MTASGQAAPCKPFSPLDLIEAGYAARRAGDIDAVLRLCADSIVFNCNADPDRPGSGTTFVGKAQLRRHLETVDQHWDVLSAERGLLRVLSPSAQDRGDTTDLKCVIAYALRHKASGHVLEGRKTHVWRVRRGRIVGLVETLDRDLINAFMDMTGATPAGDPPERPEVP
jgi:ketosteroid isomerase-like protein